MYKIMTPGPVQVPEKIIKFVFTFERMKMPI